MRKTALQKQNNNPQILKKRTSVLFSFQILIHPNALATELNNIIRINSGHTQRIIRL